MKYLGIRNDGVLDIRLVSLMGGTTKSTDKFKIGQFGTGLKYYLAYCVRNNIDFKIFCGEEEVKITTEIELIRDEKLKSCASTVKGLLSQRRWGSRGSRG
jgi:hypothetical protein